MICSKCGKEEAEWDDLCQMCWEAYCSDEWWRLNAVPFRGRGEE